MIITGKDFDEAFARACHLLTLQKEYSPRGLKTKELFNQTIVIDDPMKCVLSNPYRKLSHEYLQAEMDWYVSGDLSIEKIKEHASMWERIANPDGTINSNYGHFVFHQKIEYWKNNFISQFRYCVGSLIKDQDSRQAVINFNQPIHKYLDNKDFVCTINTQYMIREEALHCIVNMRSCDLIYGASFDVPWFAFVQSVLLDSLRMYMPSLKMGKLYHNSASLHVYEKHFKMIDEAGKNMHKAPDSLNLKDVIDYNKLVKAVQ